MFQTNYFHVICLPGCHLIVCCWKNTHNRRAFKSPNQVKNAAICVTSAGDKWLQQWRLVVTPRTRSMSASVSVRWRRLLADWHTRLFTCSWPVSADFNERVESILFCRHLFCFIVYHLVFLLVDPACILPSQHPCTNATHVDAFLLFVCVEFLRFISVSSRCSALSAFALRWCFWPTRQQCTTRSRSRCARLSDVIIRRDAPVATSARERVSAAWSRCH